MQPTAARAITRVRRGSRKPIPAHGLFGGEGVRKHIKVHENPLPGRNPTKVRTHRYPNIQLKSIFSPSLGGTVRTHVTTGVLEEIDRVGGLDNYIFQAKPEHLGVWGLQIKYAMIQAQLRRLTTSSSSRQLDATSTAVATVPRASVPATRVDRAAR